MMDPATQSMVFIIVAIGGQFIAIVAAIFAGLNAMTAKRIASDTKAETVAQTAKLDTVVKDTAVVLGHVNSEKTAAEGRENALKLKVELLREMLDEGKRAAALLAQAASHPVRSGPRADDPVSAAAPAVLKQIEHNTAATADGVKELKNGK